MILVCDLEGILWILVPLPEIPNTYIPIYKEVKQ